jgi:hypothetical protein
MNNDILQVGDTVEILENNVANHSAGNRWLKQGERIVVAGLYGDWIYYDLYYVVHKKFVKKVMPNQVEVKFRS